MTVLETTTGNTLLKIVYLDQNKWVELARAAKHPSKYSNLQRLLMHVCEEVDAGRLALPLTAANIYETYKINDPERRRDLAFVQACLSRGLVICGRHRRLKVEIGQVLADCFQLVPPNTEGRWFLSNVFFEAFTERDDERLHLEVSQRVLELVQSKSAECLFDYLVAAPEDVRMTSIRNFSAGSERLRLLVEERRRKHATESLSMHRRIYSAILMINEIEIIINFANQIGVPWRNVHDIGSSNARRLMNEVSTYYVEREIALRLEAQSRSIEENDFRDMQSFCAVIPYADAVIGENQFVNLARQAKLDKKYDTWIATDIRVLEEYFEDPRKLR